MLTRDSRRVASCQAATNQCRPSPRALLGKPAVVPERSDQCPCDRVSTDSFADVALFICPPDGRSGTTLKMAKKIHILGASGSGTTTLGANLSAALGVRHLDTDEFYWKKTAIPFTETHPIEDRLDQINEEIKSREEWVLSGSLCGWGDPLIRHFTHVVFLWIPWDIREQRLLKREVERFGEDALAPGGNRHAIHTAFIEWASKYDSASPKVRSARVHNDWIAKLPRSIRVIRVNEAYDRDALAQAVLKDLGPT